MALLTMYAKQYDVFNKIVSTAQYMPQDTNLTQYSQGQGSYYFNSNKLISGDEKYGYDYATGVKLLHRSSTVYSGFFCRIRWTVISSSSNERHPVRQMGRFNNIV